MITNFEGWQERGFRQCSGQVISLTSHQPRQMQKASRLSTCYFAALVGIVIKGVRKVEIAAKTPSITNSTLNQSIIQ